MEEKSQESEEIKKIRENPNEYISEWMEKNLKHVGKRIAKFIAIQPCSLILPNISFNSTNIRMNFNLLYISEPSSGKTKTCELYEKIVKNEKNEDNYGFYRMKGITNVILTKDLSIKKMALIVLDDLSHIGGDYEMIKTLEGALGDDQKVMRFTNNYRIDADIRASGLICGTWNDLEKYYNSFRSGMFFRMVFLFVPLTQEQKIEISKYINENISNIENIKDSEKKEKTIRNYYQDLFNIQAGENKSISPITGYFFNEEIKSTIFSAWESQIKNMNKYYSKMFNNRQMDERFIRELQEGYRFLCSNAFLNIYNREVKEGILYPNNEDLGVAIELMLENIINKFHIILSLTYLNKHRELTLNQLINSSTNQKVKKLIVNIHKEN